MFPILQVDGEVGRAACGRDSGQVGALQVPQRVLLRRGLPTKASEVARSAPVAKADDEGGER